MLVFPAIIFLFIVNLVCSFKITSRNGNNLQNYRKSALFMGRAAAVRANTKAKTDAAKAKNNGRFAKKIIIACRAGMLIILIHNLLNIYMI